jgi:hypothetical protein
MSKQLKFNIEEAASYFYNVERTENEEYLLNIILQLGKEFNELIEKYNELVFENSALKSKRPFIK